MKPAIRVNGLSKRYRVGLQRAAGYRTLRDSITEAVAAPFRRLWGRDEPSPEGTFYALKDISFDVRPGEAVGIIGRNGAGKSTLLKVLSRITEPTDGRVEVRGRMGSLLEVGTGFHPELTGRENVYLNGSILGMTRREIDRKFDEIVAFSEIERFLDTPVKRYSSGMYVRLAFAVAAHLEPEILVVDEVLAVGDAGFQKKCLGKMQDVAQHGRTVLFVSHNISAVNRLCNRAVLLSDGQVVKDGPSHEVGNYYLTSGCETSAHREWKNPARRPGNDVVRLCSVRVQTEAGDMSDTLDIRRDILVTMAYEVLQSGRILVPSLHFLNEEGVYLFVAHDWDSPWRRQPRPVGSYSSTVRIPGNFLAEGRLSVAAAVGTYRPFQVHFHERDVVGFQVVDAMDGDSARGDYSGPMPGVIRPTLEWQTDLLS
jgi:lipopolysaccharide transport system ATP-binding protein